MTDDARERRIDWIQEKVIPILDNRLTADVRTDIDEERLEKAERILAEEYYDEARGELWPVVKLSAVLLVVDFLTQMPPVVYGLVFSITGTFIMLVHADIMGSESIATHAEGTSGLVFGPTSYLDEKEARRLAKNTVTTNIGIVWLAAGFILQIAAAWLVESETLIQPRIWSRLLAYI